MALQLRRGTNAQRLQLTLKDGELVFVTDYQAAGVSPLWIGNGSTIGGVVSTAITALKDLTDVIVTNPVNNQLLNYNNTRWVNTSNITIPGTLAVSGASTLSSTLAVSGATTIGGRTTIGTYGSPQDLIVWGPTFLSNVNASGTLAVTGATTLASTLAASGNTTVGGTLAVTGATTLASTLAASGNTTVGGTLTVNGATTLASTLAASGNTTVGGTLTVNGATTLNGDLTINGTTTTVNATTLTVDDKNIELGSVATPTDTTANLGGITLRGATDKTIIWDSANNNWSSNQDWNINSGKVYKMDGINVLTGSANSTLNIAPSATGVNMAAGVLYVNKTNNRIGINTTAPAYALDVVGNSSFWNNLSVNMSGTAGTGLTVGGNTQLNGTLNTSGAATLNSATITNGLSVSGTATLAAATATSLTANTLNATTVGFTTDKVAEGGSNLYYTGARATSAANALLTASSINAHYDVTISSPINGHVLKYNGTQWVNSPGAGSSTGFTTVTGSATALDTFNSYNYGAAEYTFCVSNSTSSRQIVKVMVSILGAAGGMSPIVSIGSYHQVGANFLNAPISFTTSNNGSNVSILPSVISNYASTALTYSWTVTYFPA